MMTLRVVVDQMLAPVPGGIGRYTEELTPSSFECRRVHPGERVKRGGHTVRLAPRDKSVPRHQAVACVGTLACVSAAVPIVAA